MSRFTEEQYAQLLQSNTKIRAKLNLPPRVASPAPKPAKYRNRRTADGFDSEHERDVFYQLKAREQAGEIKSVMRQIHYALVVNGMRICDYVADYTWVDPQTNAVIVADAKSSYTRRLPMYRVKKKLMQACLSIEIVEL